MSLSNSKGSPTRPTRTVTDTTGRSVTHAKIRVERTFESLSDSRTEMLRTKLSTRFIVSIMVAYLIAVSTLTLLLVYLS